MRGYGQYCPIAKGAEIFAERWTPLVVRNLYLGCRTFNEIHEGVPRMSRTLLAQRLQALARQGVVKCSPSPTGRGSYYDLTPAGQELSEVTLALGTWGARWLEVGPKDRDPFVVLWAWKKFTKLDRLPRKRVVVRFDLRDRPKERFWLLLERAGVEICIKHPGIDEDILVNTTAEVLMLVHMGRLPLAEAARRGLWVMDGARDSVRAFPTWGGLSPFADVQPAPVASAG
jgi:DNA-binding HxlR family transcriptional regulator